MSGKGEEENGDSADTEHTVVEDGILAHLHRDPARVELPLGMGQFTGCNRAVMHDVVIGSGFIDDSCGEGKRMRTGEDHGTRLGLGANGSYRVVENASFFVDVIARVGSRDVLFVDGAVEDDVAAGGGFGGVVVVGGVIGPKDEIAIMNLDMPVELVDGSVSFLLVSLDQYRLTLARSGWRRRLAGN